VAATNAKDFRSKLGGRKMPANHLTTTDISGRAAYSTGSEIRRRLLSERREVIGAIAASSLNGHDSTENSQHSDYAAVDQIRDVEYNHRQALSRRLRQIDEAVEKIGAGVYGVCEECGNRINQKRLASDPAAALCVSCQTLIELGVPSLHM
jgi:DnaK suppressor protein